MKYNTQWYLIIVICCFSISELRSQDLALLPYPKRLNLLETGGFSINEKTVVVSMQTCMKEALVFRDWLKEASGVELRVADINFETPSENVIFFNSGPPVDFEQAMYSYQNSLLPNMQPQMMKDNSEDYTIVVMPHLMAISANQPAGIFRSIQTLRQLLPPESESSQLKLPVTIPGLTIEDSPEFRHRGLLLDCCRHFMSADFVKRYLDLMAYYKMNVLHWHLTEDQAWRIEIKKYPDLTKNGAWRDEKDGTHYGGYYSQEEIREIVQYAADRFITIIPEIEMPGHSVAAISSYPWLSCTGEKIDVENEWGVFKDIYCAGNDQTIGFLKNVLDEVCELFPSPYIHIGGDEAPKIRWEQCAKCQKRMKDEHLKTEHELQTWLIEEMATHLASKGKKIIGWDEIMEGGIPASAIVQIWRDAESGKEAADKGHFVIMSPTSHCYFDYGLESTDMYEVYTFEPRPDSFGKNKNFVMGGECNMWTEHAPQDKVDGKLFPRILAMSEVLWTYPGTRNYETFRLRVYEHFDILNRMNVDYGFETIPAVINVLAVPGKPLKVDVTTRINNPPPAVQFQVLKDNEEPTLWLSYEAPLEVTGLAEVKLRVLQNGKEFDKIISKICMKHLASGCSVALGYEPSPYYSGGGLSALTDGVLGDSGNFRDGVWQAVQGKDMEAVVDLGTVQAIHHFSTRWYHYSNAWILRPQKVEYFTSLDGTSWESAGVFNFNKMSVSDPELALSADVNELSVQGRFVKMKATNAGLCPEWHDAAGEPSWLFCDEIVVR